MRPAKQNIEGEVVDLIRRRIAAAPQQRITFADYMDWVLYDAEYGYYATNAVQIGVRGDFFTSPHLGPDFGELLAEQFVEMWQVLGCPHPFTVVEMGAGQGLIAMDVLRYLCDRTPHSGSHQPTVQPDYTAFWQALDYIIIEKAAALIAEQQHHLQTWQHPEPKVRWLTLAELEPTSITGCWFSNELLDAFPVHRVTWQGQTLQEIYVTLGPTSALAETVAAPSTANLAAYLVDQGVDFQAGYPERYRTEINLQALDWLTAVANCLKQGYVLTIDYGYTAAQYYSPGRASGTLQCYRAHGHHDDPYVSVGQQDITAHVNFSALEQHGAQVGLERLGWTQQAPFLMGLGLGDRLVSNNSRESLSDLTDILRRRDALHALMNPLGLGGFQVLLQGKGLTPPQKQRRLQGFQMEHLATPILSL